MKALFKTSMIVVAAAGIMALAAGTALAKPANSNIYQPGQNTMKIDPQAVVSMQELAANGQLVPVDDADENVVPPDEQCASCPAPGDDSNIPDNPGDENLDGGQDQPGTPGNLDTPDTPQQPATTQTVETPKVTETKLPNTGTQLVLLAGLGLTLAAVALGVRRFAVKRAS